MINILCDGCRKTLTEHQCLKVTVESGLPSRMFERNEFQFCSDCWGAIIDAGAKKIKVDKEAHSGITRTPKT